MQTQLHHRPGASAREEGSLGRMLVSVKTVFNAVQKKKNDDAT